VEPTAFEFLSVEVPPQAAKNRESIPSVINFFMVYLFIFFNYNARVQSPPTLFYALNHKCEDF
jgi:hypothetical protein